jgi:hypothetical protein
VMTEDDATVWHWHALPSQKYVDTFGVSIAIPAAIGNADKNNVNWIQISADTLFGSKHKYGAHVLTPKPPPIVAPESADMMFCRQQHSVAKPAAFARTAMAVASAF